jgi:hypothetical protein
MELERLPCGQLQHVLDQRAIAVAIPRVLLDFLCYICVQYCSSGVSPAETVSQTCWNQRILSAYFVDRVK